MGEMVHAFPRVQLRHPSWTRTLEEPQYVLFKSDGDLNMISGLRRGMDGGYMATNRSGVDSGIVGCGFHKSKSHRLMTQKYLTLANEARVVARQGDLNAIGYYLDGKRESDHIFGCMLVVFA